MASLLKQTLHFTHPSHYLREDNIDSEFECGGCHTLGHGKRYRCTVCYFDLHDRCASCPSSISLEFHPQHRLTLVNQIVAHGKLCTICGDNVNGLFYTCKKCGFHVHPLCTQLPMRVKHPRHPHHELTLQPSPSVGQCMVCGGTCCQKLWRYRCDQIKVDAHIECAFVENAPPPMTAPGLPPPIAAKDWCQRSPVNAMAVPVQPPPPIIYPPNDYYCSGYAYAYPYPSYGPYNYIPQPGLNSVYYPMPQPAQFSPGGGETRRKIYKVLGIITGKVLLATVTGGLLF